MSDSTLTNPLLRTLREGGLAASLIVRLFDGPEIGRIAATAGLDALYVDLEHSPCRCNPPAASATPPARRA